MNKLEKILHDVLEPRHGQPYTADKVAEIAGMKNAQILEWAVIYLDAKNRGAFFRAIGIDDSVETSSALRRAFDAIKQSNN